MDYMNRQRPEVLVKYLGRDTLRWRPVGWLMNSLGVEGFFYLL
jgi:hypothetical protein